MAALRDADLEDAVEDAVDSGRPFLGICVGMQMLFEASEEDDAAVGLGVIPGTHPLAGVRTAAAADAMEPVDADIARRPDVRRPAGRGVGVLRALAARRARRSRQSIAATCAYGGVVNAAFRRGNVFATQFHPEKSGAWGLAMLGNFVRIAAETVGPMMVELFPAIDLHDGQVVRLTQGDYGDATVYGNDPVAVARSFADAGATWIHVVDLDAARSGSPENRPVVAAIAAALVGRASVQTGGGVRALADAQAAGRRRRGPRRDGLGGGPASRRWSRPQPRSSTSPSVSITATARSPSTAGPRVRGVSLDEALGWFPAASAFVITDIARDGMLEGPDVDGLAAVAARAVGPVIASGGVSSLADIAALADDLRDRRHHHRQGDLRRPVHRGRSAEGAAHR